MLIFSFLKFTIKILPYVYYNLHEIIEIVIFEVLHIGEAT